VHWSDPSVALKKYKKASTRPVAFACKIKFVYMFKKYTHAIIIKLIITEKFDAPEIAEKVINLIIFAAIFSTSV